MAHAAEPFIPADSDWTEIYEMLCGNCRHQLSCDVCEGMITAKDGTDWPDGGWVHDPGAGVTCLSYDTKPLPRMPRQQLRAIQRAPEDRLPPVCGGCAARKGTEASVSGHTRRDFRNAVKSKHRFTCHETGELCGGWCRAIRLSS